MCCTCLTDKVKTIQICEFSAHTVQIRAVLSHLKLNLEALLQLSCITRPRWVAGPERASQKRQLGTQACSLSCLGPWTSQVTALKEERFDTWRMLAADKSEVAFFAGSILITYKA